VNSPLSALSLYLNHHRTSILTPVPYWMRIIFFHTLPTFLFLKKPHEKPQTRQRCISSADSPLVLRRVKTNQIKLPMEMNYLIEQFLQRSNDIKYICKRIAVDREEMNVRQRKFSTKKIILIYFLFF